MEISLLNKLKSTNDIQGQRSENDENIIVICYDRNNRMENLKIRLDKINANVVFHTEFELCKNFIQSIERQKIFIIISSSQILKRRSATIPDIMAGEKFLILYLIFLK
jgi:hypothetical protein